MSITLNFSHADNIATELGKLVQPGSDPLLTAVYAGFVSVAAVCVYEMSIKEIFINFGTKKHPVLGNVMQDLFDRINGRVQYRSIREEYVPRFGEKYEKKFKRIVKDQTRTFLQTTGRDFVSSYGNIVTWRNDFVHAGNSPSTATFNEVVQAYEDGKKVIACLNSTMDR
jgi:hypothetical protein